MPAMASVRTWLSISALAVLVSLAGAGWAGVARSAQQVGEAVVVVSSVRGVLGQETREITVKDNVFHQEQLETSEDAATRIVFLDGTELSIGPSSLVTLDRYVYDPDTGTGALVMNFLSGVFEFASGSIPSSGYDLRTPFANLAIRGTKISLVVGAEEELVGVAEGEVRLRSERGQFAIGTGSCLLLRDLRDGSGTAQVQSGAACGLLLLGR
jgi:hypothetical protein